MTPQSHLSEDEVRAVVSYIKLLSPVFSQAKIKKILTLPPAPPFSQERIIEGREVYQKAQCTQCHGQEGKGNGPLAKNLSSKPMDLTARPFKGGSTPQDIVRILLTGIEGTPMDSYQFILEDQALWDLAYYIDSLGGEPQQTEDEKKGMAIVKGLQFPSPR